MNFKMATITAALVLSGCTSVEFSKTGDYVATPFEENCAFTVYTTRPEQAFKEIGVVDLLGDLPKTVSKTKETVRKEVCTNGGNGLLLWEANGRGGYTKGTVIYIGKKA